MGLVAQSLYAKAAPVYDEVESFKFQAVQVSAVSVMNCIGRISIGKPSWDVQGRTGGMLMYLRRHIRRLREKSYGPTPGILYFSRRSAVFHLSASGRVHRGCGRALEG